MIIADAIRGGPETDLLTAEEEMGGAAFTLFPAYPDISSAAPVDWPGHRLISMVNLGVDFTEMALERAHGGKGSINHANIGLKRPIESKGYKYSSPDALDNVEDELLRLFMKKILFYSYRFERVVTNRLDSRNTEKYKKCWDCKKLDMRNYTGFDPRNPKNYSKGEDSKALNLRIKDLLRKKVLSSWNFSGFCRLNFKCDIFREMEQTLFSAHERVERGNLEYAKDSLEKDTISFFNFPVNSPALPPIPHSPCDDLALVER